MSLTAKPSGMLCSVMARAMTNPSRSSSADRSRCVSCLCSANLHNKSKRCGFSDGQSLAWHCRIRAPLISAQSPSSSWGRAVFLHVGRTGMHGCGAPATLPFYAQRPQRAAFSAAQRARGWAAASCPGCPCRRCSAAAPHFERLHSEQLQKLDVQHFGCASAALELQVAAIIMYVYVTAQREQHSSAF